MSNVTVGRYLLGLAATLIVFASLTVTALQLRRRFLPDWSGAPARLAEAVIGLAALTAALEALGAVGLFRLGPIVAACALIGLGTWRAVGGRQGARPRAARSCDAWPSRRRLELAVGAAIVIVAGVTAEWAGPTLESYDVGIRTLDSLWYHLPWAASFAQSGNVVSLRFTDIEYLTAFYPATAEMFHGLGIVLLGRDTLSPGANLIWLGLVLLAAYCIGSPRGRGLLTLTAGALAMATPAVGLSQAGSAANDVVGVFFVLAATALLINGEQRRACAVLAGVAAGLAVSVKLSMLAPALALSIGAVVVSAPGRRRATGVAWFAALLVAGGFWYLRNLIAVGNPLPWLALPGLSHPAAPLQQHTAFSVVHYLSDSQVISRVLEPGLVSGLGPWWPLLLASALVGPLLCLAPGADRVLRVLGLVALTSTVAYLLTPETAAGPAGQPLGFAFNLRYAAPALTLSLVILPLAPAFQGERRQAAVLALIALALVATLAQSRLWPSDYLAGALALGAGTGVVLAAAAYRRVRPGAAPVGRRRAPWGAWRAAGLLTLMTLLVAGAAGGYAWQRQYLRGRYAFHRGVSYLARTWALFRHVHDARVGVVGTFGGFFAYPLFGVDDSNRVQYVAHHGPHGSFTAIATCSGWRSVLDTERLRYVLTTPSRDPWHPKPLHPSPEGAWTASDPAAHLIYHRRAAGQTISVYELSGRLDPAGCR